MKFDKKKKKKETLYRYNLDISASSFTLSKRLFIIIVKM